MKCSLLMPKDYSYRDTWKHRYSRAYNKAKRGNLTKKEMGPPLRFLDNIGKIDFEKKRKQNFGRKAKHHSQN